MNPTRVLLSLLAERLGQTAGRWPRQLFGGAEAPTLREAIAARVEPRLMAPDAGQFGDRPLRVFHGTPEEFSPEGIRALTQSPDGGASGAGPVRLGPNAGFYDVGGKPFNADREAVRRLNRLMDGGGEIEVELPIARLNATQETVNPDFAQAATRVRGDGYDLPAVVKYQGRYYVTDGHHRLAAQAAQGRTNARVRLFDLDGDTQTSFPLLDSPAPDAPNSVSRTDGGASGAGNAADRFRTNDTPVPVNEGWDTAGSLQQGVDDLAAQRGGWDTMGGRDMGEALIRRHGLDGALEQINRIMADPASRRARQRNGDQGAWEAVQRYIQASVNRRGIGLAPDAPNAGQRGGNGAALAALATLPPGAITLRELLRDHYGTA